MGMNESQFRELKERMGGVEIALPKPAAEMLKRRGVPNKWEARFAKEVLDCQMAVEEINWYGFEQLKLNLANGGWYTPDFLTWGPGGIVAYEIKGFWRTDARLRVRLAAACHPWLSLIGVTRDRDTGEWQYERF